MLEDINKHIKIAQIADRFNLMDCNKEDIQLTTLVTMLLHSLYVPAQVIHHDLLTPNALWKVSFH